MRHCVTSPMPGGGGRDSGSPTIRVPGLVERKRRT
nr:unnamed protein product [Callosobruchus chinensis]